VCNLTQNAVQEKAPDSVVENIPTGACGSETSHDSQRKTVTACQQGYEISIFLCKYVPAFAQSDLTPFSSSLPNKTLNPGDRGFLVCQPRAPLQRSDPHNRCTRHRSFPFLFVYIFFFAPTRAFPHPCALRARHYGHPESTDTAEYKAKGEVERGSQKRGNCRQVIPLHKLVSVVQAGTFASQSKRRPLRKGVRENGTALFELSMLTQGGEMDMQGGDASSVVSRARMQTYCETDCELLRCNFE